MMNFIILLKLLILTFFKDARVISCSSTTIHWNPYEATHLKPSVREYYKNSQYAMIPVPQIHDDNPSDVQDEEGTTGTFNVYVRKFSRSGQRTRKHLWLISGGPGSSTSGIERALNLNLFDTTIYIMDNRGLGHSQQLCHHSRSRECQKNPKKCYESLNYSPKLISIHETAKDYNYISELIMRLNGGIDYEFYAYGSSYGATLAYAAFRYDPFLYSGMLLEAFTPQFRLNGNFDVRKHVVSSCFKSESCRKVFGGKVSEKEAEGLMAEVMQKDNKNPCKEALDFLARHNGYNLTGLLNSYIRVAFYKKTGLRSAFIPLLYNAARCTNIIEFNVLMSKFHAGFQAHGNETKTETFDLLESHCSSTPNTNHFFGGHIRFSEYSFESEEKMKKCLQTGYLDAANWADICGMVSDFREDYRPFLYEPEVPIVTTKFLERSPTRLVIVTGKLDTQTLHDSAQKEFDRLPLNEKYLFSADHAGHGVIDSWEVPGLKLETVLSFTMTGSESDKAKIITSINDHNSNPERIWNNWDRQIFDENDFCGGEIDWRLRLRWRWRWSKVLVVIGGAFLVPLSTALIQEYRREEAGKEQEEGEEEEEYFDYYDDDYE